MLMLTLLQVSTVLAYLADACSHGYGTAQLPQLQAAAGLGGSPAADELLVKVQHAVVDPNNCSLGYVKSQLPLFDVSYGQIKVVAALVAAGEGGSAAAGGAWLHQGFAVKSMACVLLLELMMERHSHYSACL
jgi:hypothetical protein